VGYELCFNFSYSLREKTKAHRRLVDDISAEVKKERLARLNKVYDAGRKRTLDAMVGSTQVVLVEKQVEGGWSGRSEGNVRVMIQGEIQSYQIQKGDFVVVDITTRQNGTLTGKPTSILKTLK
jgi:tRNA A37 methylthiotransferase MiaB